VRRGGNNSPVMEQIPLADRALEDEVQVLRKRLVYGIIFIVGLFVFGTVGYKLLDPNVTWLDALYMTVISLTTTGFGEYVQPTPTVRSFTIGLLIVGMLGAAYFVTTATAFVLEGSLGHVVRRRRMLKEIASFTEHQIVCGSDETALYAARELRSIKKSCVVVCAKSEVAEEFRKDLPDVPIMTADPTEDSTLQAAGIDRAAGVIACEEGTKDNLLITLTARQLNARVRIITRVAETHAEQKAKNAGANSVVCPNFTGGMRLVSELVRPTVVSFLDIMLRDKDKNLRVEEVRIAGDSCVVGRKLGEIDFRSISNALVMACKLGETRWIYNPPGDLEVLPGYTFILMGSPEDVNAVRYSLNQPAREGSVPRFVKPSITA
jgi:voltage-gated potassium channel